MKLAITGDWHLRAMTPEGRKDDFCFTQYHKVRQVLEIAKENKCAAIIQPGDMWDSYNPARSTMTMYIRLLKSYDIPVITVIGQHDMVMRSTDIEKTATGLFEAANIVQIAGMESISIGNVGIYGAWYGYEIPVPEKDLHYVNVLVAHVGVGDRALFPGDTRESPRSYLRRAAGYKYVIVGDYHYPFLYQEDDRAIINVGALVRLRRGIDESLKPKVTILDVYQNTYKDIPLSIEEDVFKPAEEKKENETITKLIELISQNKQLAVSFDDNLALAIKTQQVPEDVVKYITGARQTIVDGGEKNHGS